ncbi:DUF6461 domain-containing protein [Streptomyces sp. NPDC048272]|uniref:DUF6461 domain-containing protein n=1 Tax=Streptomyces sp. NPDC048272 TaxID=3154616 RepID=UPI003436FC66
MTDGIKWLSDLGSHVEGVVFARGLSAGELAVRMGGDPCEATEPITDGEVEHLGMRGGTYGVRGDGVVRIGEAAGWAFALEYGDSTGTDRLEAIASHGVEAVHYLPMSARPPARFHYAKNGVLTCSFGIGEEHRRWGAEPDFLLPELIDAQVLHPDGSKNFPPSREHFAAYRKRALGVLEQRFHLSLPRTVIGERRLPAYAVRGTPAMRVGQDPDHQQIKAWAVAQNLTWDDTGGGVPSDIREAWDDHIVRQDSRGTG